MGIPDLALASTLTAHCTGMDQQFQEAAAAIKTQVNKTLTDEELKEVDALYKQATCGDINIEKPSAIDIKGCAKWEAWNNKKGVSSEDAKQQYVAFVDKMKEKHGVA